MNFLLDGISRATTLILTLNREIIEIVSLSLRVSGVATGIACLIGLPVGFSIAINVFRGKQLLTTFLNTLMAMPTVTAGLLIYAFLSRRGLFGELGLLMTPTAIIIGQVFLATPIIAALTVSAVSGVDPRVARTARSLGADEWRVMAAVFGEARYAIAAAVAAGFGRVIAEVGAAMILGGNIKGYTRTITTAIATETAKGDFGLAIALGVILIALAFSVNLLTQYLQSRVS